MHEIEPPRRVQTRTSVPETPARDDKWTPGETILFAVTSSLGLWAAIIAGLELLLG